MRKQKENTEAKENLKRWKEKWEERLDNLKRKKVEEDYEGEKADLEGQKENIEEIMKSWRYEAIAWGKKLREFEEKGRDKKKQSSEEAPKRSYDQADLVDNSFLICNGLLQKFEEIPTQVNDLQSLINVPLLRKLPVTSDEEIMYPELSDYVCTREEERRSTIAKNISSALASSIDREFSGNKSESMLQYPLDSMIRVPLETFCRFLGNVLPIEIDRDKADSGTTTIGTKRPDFL
ncbi:15769_t:CDS:2, partial [Funneliformis caledonium]